MAPAVYRLLGLRYLMQRWDRAVLIVVSIALGVATLVSTRVLNQCVEAAAQDTTTPGGAADLYVTNGEGGVLRSLGEDLRSAHILGVESVHPIVFDRVTLPDLDGRVAVLLGAEVSSQLLKKDNPLKVTVKWSKEGPAIQLGILFGAIQAGDFTKASELWERIPGRLVMVSQSIFDEWKRKAGSGHPLIIRYATRDVECLPVGIVEFEKDSPLAAMGNNFIGMEVGQASRVIRPAPTLATAAIVGTAGEAAWGLEYPPKINRLDIFLTPGADKETVRLAIARYTGSRADVRTPEAQRRSTQEIVSGLQTGFMVCSAGAMIVGLFLVYNALSVTVAERRPDIGILRSLGATRGQIVLLFSVAAAVLGLVGALLGVPLGLLLSEITLSQFRGELESIFLNPDINPTRLSWSSIGLSVLAGIATAVLAALVPAIQAAMDDPAHVVRRSSGGAKGNWRLVHRAACAGLIVGGVVMITARHYLPPRAGAIGGMMVVLVGMLLAAPLFVIGLVALLRPLVRTCCGIEMRMAFDNLTRAPGRSGVVIGALGAGVALMFQTAGVGRSNEEPLVDWIKQVVQADQFVFSGTMTTANSSNSPMSESIVQELRKVPEVERVMAIRYSRPEYNGTVVYLIALDTEAYVKATRARVPAGIPGLERFLDLPGTNDVLVSENFAQRHGVRVGQTIYLPGPSGPVSLRVVGTVIDYSWNRGSVMMDRARYAKLFGDELVDICHVFRKPHGSNPTPGRQVEAFALEHGLMAADRDAIRKFLTELISRVYLLAYLQQIIVGVVAALGVVTALLISVLQRKRELGLLLAVGATPAQVLRSVLAEAVLMGVFGTFLGILIGLPMEWYVLKVVMLEESGFVFDVLVPWRQALGIAAASITTATIAGLLPAYHAVRTRIPDAIQWE